MGTVFINVMLVCLEEGEGFLQRDLRIDPWGTK